MATSQYKKGTAAPQLPKMAPPMAATVRLTRQREVQGMSETCSPSPGHAAQTASSARALKIPDTSHRDGRPPESEKQLPARRWQRWRVCNRQGETVQCVGDGCYTTGACRPSPPPYRHDSTLGGQATTRSSPQPSNATMSAATAQQPVPPLSPPLRQIDCRCARVDEATG